MSEPESLFVPPGHFYSPIPDRDDARIGVDRAARRRNDMPGGVHIDGQAMVALWRRISPAMASMPFGDAAGEKEFRYHYLNDMYSYGDAAVYYGLVGHLRPRRIIEIGSGYSSALALDMRDLFARDLDLTFIEPYPSTLNSLLREGDRARTKVVVQKVQDVPLETFDSLEANDILFVDSSHVAKTGSDVCFEVFEILPRLKPGVVVHFHDCFWPFEYPAQWAVDQNRGWNELYLLRAFLMYNQAFEVMFFNSYFYIRHRQEAEGSLLTRNPGGGLWLRRR